VAAHGTHSSPRRFHPRIDGWRGRILRRKASADKIRLPRNVVVLLATRIKSNERELEGAFIRMTCFAALKDEPSPWHDA
jgi:chromosomal replication initiation ATPase DnaA